MTANTQETPVVEQKSSDKEMNFRALEAQRKQEQALRLQEQTMRMEAEKKAQELEKRLQELESRSKDVEEEDDDEPYVGHKKLNKRLSTLERKLKEEQMKGAEEIAQKLYEKKEQERWLEDHQDFYEVLNQAENFANENPGLAKMILQMPDGFERQKLVYENIKTLNKFTQQKSKESGIQEKVNNNRKGLYYQPTNVGSAPYACTGDFSPAGQKNAYDKMQELKSRLRL